MATVVSSYVRAPLVRRGAERGTPGRRAKRSREGARRASKKRVRNVFDLFVFVFRHLFSFSAGRGHGQQPMIVKIAVVARVTRRDTSGFGRPGPDRNAPPPGLRRREGGKRRGRRVVCTKDSRATDGPRQSYGERATERPCPFVLLKT